MDSEDRSTQKDTSSSAVTSSLSDLIARLEKATSGDRLLDALIECEVRRFQAYAVGLNDKQRSHWKPVGTKGEVIDNQGLTRYHSPLHSLSMDAAISLVPRPMCWNGGEVNEDDQPWACITDSEGTDYAATAATPILALCIAALKALSQIESLPANDSAETRLEI